MVDATQRTPEKNQTLDSIEDGAREDYGALVTKIETSVDPGHGAADALLQCALNACAAALKKLESDLEPPTTAEAATNLLKADGALLGAFHDQFCRQVYDAEAVMQGVDLAHKPRSKTLQQYIADHAQDTYSTLLNRQNPVDPVKTQAETPLQQVTPQLVADCLRRISVGSGLPADGQVLHSLVQGLFQYLWCGPPDAPHQAICMQESESLWNLASSKLSQLVLGQSASGKDNCMDILNRFIKQIRDDDRNVLRAETILTQGGVTKAGVLKILEQHGGYLLFFNPELESLLSRRKEHFLVEQDLIGLLDGVPVGKATATECKNIPRPHCWAALGSQHNVYLRELAGDSCARLRFQVTMLSGESSANEGFAEKMFSRRASEALLVQLLRITLRAQHPVPHADATQVRLRRQRRNPDEQASEPGGHDATPLRPEVPTTHFSASAMLAMAGYIDGCSEACKAHPTSESISAVRKTYGKVMGSCADANLCVRNSMLRVALPDCPMDTSCRLLDVLSAINKAEVFATNQVYIERILHSQQTNRKRKEESMDETPAPEVPDLTPVQFACRRLLDCLALDADLWKLAQNEGIPFQLSQTGCPRWYNFRQLNFTRRKKAQPIHAQYGGLENLYTYGKASGWKDVLEALLESGVVVRKTDDDKCVRLVFTARGAQHFDLWKVSKNADALYDYAPTDAPAPQKASGRPSPGG